jgi:hypothetical protein
MKKICPVMSSGRGNNQNCLETECAIWTKSGCAIKVIAVSVPAKSKKKE